MKQTSIADAIKWKYPAADFDTVEQKVTAWRSTSIPQPSDVEVEAIRQEYIAHRAANLYKEKRASEYPSVGDQLDAIWKIIDTKADSEADMLKEKILAVKAKYPKPNGF